MDVKEANRFFWIYTRDFGLITSVAQGVRLDKSKLRFALQEYSIADISFVRGKSGWRLTNATPLWNVFSEFKGEENKCRTALNVIALVRRLIQGESSEVHIFDLVVDTLEVLRTKQLSTKELRGFEALWVLQILEALGYIGDGGVKQEAKELWDTQEWERSNEKRSEFAREINAALRSTHL